MISHIFLMLFIYLFVTHRYSRRKTLGICFSSFLLLSLSDCLKLNIFPDSRLCYLFVTLSQIFITQSTGLFISKTRDSKVLFMGLTSSNYVIAGSIADTFYMTELCYSRATGTQQKELFLIPGATHIQTYHVPEYVNQAVNKLTEFFSKNL